MTWDKPKSLEEEFNDFQKMDVDSWFNIRGPRPGENSRELQAELRKQGPPVL